MKLTVQGRPYVHEGDANVLRLLEASNESVLYATVRLNGEILRRRDFENIPLAEGDTVDFVYYMGGGGLTAA